MYDHCGMKTFLFGDFSLPQEFSGTKVTSRMMYHSATQDCHIRMI